MNWVSNRFRIHRILQIWPLATIIYSQTSRDSCVVDVLSQTKKLNGKQKDILKGLTNHIIWKAWKVKRSLDSLYRGKTTVHWEIKPIFARKINSSSFCHVNIKQPRIMKCHMCFFFQANRYIFFTDFDDSLSLKGKLFGGNPTFKSFHYVAGLYEAQQLFCTGILISAKHVLTVGICLKRFFVNPNIDYSYYHVKLGTDYLYEKNLKFSFKNVKIHMHYNYVNEDLPHNIGLITVRSLYYIFTLYVFKLHKLYYLRQLWRKSGFRKKKFFYDFKT